MPAKNPMRTVFGVLFEMFRERFLEIDAGSIAVSLETNFTQSLGIVAAPGLIVAMYMCPHFMTLSFQQSSPAVEWALRSDRLFFPAYSFAVVGFVTFFEWDMLFPDRRDFLVLTALPVLVRDFFLSKLASIGVFLLSLLIAVNGFSIVLLPPLSMLVRQASGVGMLRLAFDQIIVTGAAGLFGFLLVGSLRCLLMSLSNPLIFRRVSSWIQLVGMTAMVLTLFLYPIYAPAMRSIAAAYPQWLSFFPPYWFVGIYDLLSPASNPLFARLGAFAFQVIGVTTLLFLVGWFIAFARNYRRTLEAEPAQEARGRGNLIRWLASVQEERGMLDFIATTLSRSQKHRLFLVTYLSVGLAFALLLALGIEEGKLVVFPDGLRAFPFLLSFFVVSGFRAVFQFPSELPANWIFQMSEGDWLEVSRKATRKIVAFAGLLPLLVLFLPFEIVSFGWRVGLFHWAFQVQVSLVLIELFFWTFDKVPFTCSYVPGRSSMALLLALYAYGFTNYASWMAGLESATENSILGSILFFLGSSCTLVILWSRPSAHGPLRFESTESSLQTLDLS